MWETEKAQLRATIWTRLIHGRTICDAMGNHHRFTAQVSETRFLPSIDLRSERQPDNHLRRVTLDDGD
jgi:hypothetical protein